MKKMDIKRVLFVCTGNSCRSIMAEAYMKKRSKEDGLNLDIESAGTLGIEGLEPTKEARKVLEIEGVDTGGCRSRVLTDALVKWADIILVMEPVHKLKVLEMAPDAANKIHFLGEFNPEQGDILIPDPIGRPLAFYRATFRIIRQSIEELIRCLKK